MSFQKHSGKKWKAVLRCQPSSPVSDIPQNPPVPVQASSEKQINKCSSYSDHGSRGEPENQETHVKTYGACWLQRNQRRWEAGRGEAIYGKDKSWRHTADPCSQPTREPSVNYKAEGDEETRPHGKQHFTGKKPLCGRRKQRYWALRQKSISYGNVSSKAKRHEEKRR